MLLEFGSEDGAARELPSHLCKASCETGKWEASTMLISLISSTSHLGETGNLLTLVRAATH